MRKSITLTVLATLIAGSVTAHANDKDEANAFAQAKISLTQAIEVATKETGAKAISSEFEFDHNKGIYSVELLSDENKEIEVEVDAQSGEVLKIELDD